MQQRLGNLGWQCIIGRATRFAQIALFTNGVLRNKLIFFFSHARVFSTIYHLRGVEFLSRIVNARSRDVWHIGHGTQARESKKLMSLITGRTC